jgi:pimeloyl-ACP methyl ester carboxylesterase
MADQNALAPGTHTITIDGVRQRYIVAGSGPVCIALSGGPGVSWEYLRMPAVERHATMVYIEPVGTTPDNRLASHPVGYTVGTYTSFMAGVLSHLGIPEACILGHSFGGLVAANFALAAPEMTSGLILYASEVTNGTEFDVEAERNFEKFVVEHADAPGISTLAEALLSDPGPDAESKSAYLRAILPAYFADYYARESEFGPLLGGIRLSDVDNPEFSLRGSLERFKVPALVIAGRHDPVCGPRWAAELHDGIPNAELVMFEESGHLPHLEQPAGFAAAIADFLRG